jgi:hypothetical protein
VLSRTPLANSRRMATWLSARTVPWWPSSIVMQSMPGPSAPSDHSCTVWSAEPEASR